RAHAPVRGVPGGSADVGAARSRDRPGGRGGDPAGGRRSRSRAVRRAERVAGAGLLAAAVLWWLLVPSYPNYDAYYHLVWGREILDGLKPSFEAYAAPTQHPLYVAYAALVGLAGEDADRLLVLTTLLCLVALVWGTWRLGLALF